MNSGKKIYWVSIHYGHMGGLAGVILFFILNHFGKNPLLIPPFLDFRILLFPILLVFGIRDFKENKNNGILHFWQGFSIGFLIFLVSGTIMSLFILILGSFIDRSFLADYIQLSLARIEGARDQIIEQVGEAAYQKTLEIIPGTTLWDLTLDYFIKGLPIGLLLTILITLFLRKTPN